MKRITTKPKLSAIKKPSLNIPAMPKVKGVLNPSRLLNIKI